jgi:hypothetical protein
MAKCPIGYVLCGWMACRVLDHIRQTYMNAALVQEGHTKLEEVAHKRLAVVGGSYATGWCTGIGHNRKQGIGCRSTSLPPCRPATQANNKRQEMKCTI